MRRNLANQIPLYVRGQATQPRKPGSAASWFLTGGSDLPAEFSSGKESIRRRPSTAMEEGGHSSEERAPDAVVPNNDQVGLRHHVPVTDIERFIHEALLQEQRQRLEDNKAIPLPKHPDELVPEFRRFKRHAKHVVSIPDPEYPTFERKDQFVRLPPSKNHPWVEDTPYGPHIVHGDGQLGVIGTGEVGFDADHVAHALPKTWRGLHHRSILGKSLPDHNGNILNGDTTIKHSLSLTGRGVFATRDVKAGEVLMVVASTAQSLGLSGEQRRLVEMCVDILRNAYEGKEEDRDFLHNWILTGQLSSMVEKWPERLTTEVIEKLGGREVLDALELHPAHISRLAAVIDMNSFLVESAFDERRGMAYWPEAGFLNHSCDPNATYEIIPDHMFKESDYFVDRSEGEVGVVDEAIEDVPLSNTIGSSTSSAPGTGEASSAHKGDRPSVPSPGDGVTTTEGNDGDDMQLYKEVDLTAKGAPGHLFCVRATKDMVAGEEILISYVPTEWNFDARQYVLHDRYRFRCKCPRCAPTIDSKYAMFPRFMLFVLVFLLTLQLWLFREKQRLMYADGDSPEGEVPNRRKGVRYLLEEQGRANRDSALYDLGSRSRVPETMYADDPYTRTPK